MQDRRCACSVRVVARKESSACGRSHYALERRPAPPGAGQAKALGRRRGGRARLLRADSGWRRARGAPAAALVEAGAQLFVVGKGCAGRLRHFARHLAVLYAGGAQRAQAALRPRQGDSLSRHAWLLPRAAPAQLQPATEAHPARSHEDRHGRASGVARRSRADTPCGQAQGCIMETAWRVGKILRCKVPPRRACKADRTHAHRATIVSTAFQRMSFSPGAHAVRGPSSAGGAGGVVGEAGRAGRVGHARALPAGHARRAVAHVAFAQRRQLRLRAAATVPVACTRTNGINTPQLLCSALSLCTSCMARQLRPHAWPRACMSSKLRNKKAVCDVSPCPAHHDWPTSDWLWLDRLRLEVCDTRGRRGQRAAAPA